MLLTHLQEARSIGQSLSLYKRNAQLILGESTSHMDDMTLDIFRTEFHLKFLFGSKAAAVDSHERMAMFQRVIMTLSEHCEPTHVVDAV